MVSTHTVTLRRIAVVGLHHNEVRYRAMCSCRWTSAPHRSSAGAQHDAVALHLMKLPEVAARRRQERIVESKAQRMRLYGR